MENNIFKNDNHNREMWAGPEAFQFIYDKNNPTDVIVNIHPKGTGKSHSMDQYTMQQVEKNNFLASVMYLRDTEIGHKTGFYSSAEQIIKKYDLKGWQLKWNTSEHFVKKGNKEIMLWGFDSGEKKITSFATQLSWVNYDEFIAPEYALKSYKEQVHRSNKLIKTISSLRRKLAPDGKIVLNGNLHYLEPKFGKMIYDNFDVTKIRETVLKNGFWFGILKGEKGFPNGISFFIADPEINQFLDSEKAKIEYIGEEQNQAMTESLPDEALRKEFPFRKSYSNIEFIEESEVNYRDIEFISSSIDPASGKDNFGAVFIGYDKRKRKIVLLDSMQEKTLGKKNIELLDTIDNFFKKFNKKFLELWSFKQHEDSFAYTFDTNQKLTPLTEANKLFEREKDKKPDRRIITTDKFMAFVEPAKKSGEWDHTGSINKIESILESEKLVVVKTESNLQLVTDIMDVRVKLDESKLPEIKYKIISHSDLWDPLKYGVQIFFDVERGRLFREFWGYSK